MVAVAVEGDAEVEPAVAHRLLQEREVMAAPQPSLMFLLLGVLDRGHLGTEPLERRRRDPRIGAVRAIDPDPERQVGAEALEHVVEA